jgi:porphobilinogen synthase
VTIRPLVPPGGPVILPRGPAMPARTRPAFARFHRLRRREALRRLVRETRLDPASLVLPVFVDARAAEPTPIASLPGHMRWPPAGVAEIAARAADASIGGLLFFGLPDEKDDGRAAADALGPVPSALRAIRAAYPELALLADVCLCEYTTHGHCGIVRDDGSIDNDATLPLLADAALAYAEAGADIVAPSDMMDGRVAAIRGALDEAGHLETAILSYAAKFASAFYGPFRDAAECAPQFGDRAGYQMDPPNRREAIREIAEDVAEGADLVMVKPAGPYLDVIAAVRERTDLPVAAYQVSGEYAALHAAADRGWLDLRRGALESLTGIARAGADVIVTYFALEAAAWLRAGPSGGQAGPSGRDAGASGRDNR